MKKNKKPSVKFYEVDDTVVCVWNNGEEVQGFVVETGSVFPPLKAISEGRYLKINIG